MDKYKDSLKKYSYALKEKSTLLKLLETENCNSLQEVRNIISNCKWEKVITGSIYNFNSEEFNEECPIFCSGILINTDIKIVEILKNGSMYDIITEGNIDTNLLIFGLTIYINYKDKNIKIGNILNINNNTISINSELNHFELDMIINNYIITT